MSNEASMKPGETTKETRDIATVYVDTNTTKTLHDMGAQTNPQLKLNLVDLPTRRHKLNSSVGITPEQGAFLFNDKINEFSERFTTFFTSRNVSYDVGDIDEDENKIKRFLFDIG